MRGNCYFEIGEFEKAIPDYEEAVTADPDDRSARILLCLTLFYAGEFVRATSGKNNIGKYNSDLPKFKTECSEANLHYLFLQRNFKVGRLRIDHSWR